jgi:outer membrane receptor for ferrienterochelin and colicin
MRSFLLLFLFLLSFADGNAQAKAGLKGQVADSTSKPLAYVTVSLSREKAAQPLGTTYTDAKGSFSFAAVDTGIYVVTVSHAGYAPQEKTVRTGSDIAPLSFSLHPANAILQGITVTGRRPLVEQSDDKLTYNVENDPAAKTETAIDLLRKTPFVSVDGDNNVQVNGQSNFKVLLNGRETAMFSQNVKEALKGFPGALISKIEVITSPSAKYDAEGVGGIINIITKKKVAGYNGSLSSYYSTNNMFSENANASVKWGKLGITGYYSLSAGNRQRGANLNETVAKVPSLFSRRTISGKRLSDYFYNFGNLEVSYEMDSLNTVSAYGNLSGGRSSSMLDQEVTTQPASGTTQISSFDQETRNVYPTSSVGLDYIRRFKKNKLREFSLRMNGQFSKNNGRNNSVQSASSYQRFVNNNSESDNKEYTIQTDYAVSLPKGERLEIGAKAILRRASSDFESLEKYEEGVPYKINPANTNVFRYQQEVYSAYGSYNFKLRAYALRVGTRAEHTDIKGDFTSSNTLVAQHYTNLIPNIQVTRRWSPRYTGVLSYTLRLQRPYITNLNPFRNNNDSLNIFYGNPELGPQTIHNVSLQNRFVLGKTFAGLTLTGSYSNSLIMQYAEFDKASFITTTTYGNLGEEYQVSLGMNVNSAVTPKWNLGANGVGRYNSVRSTRPGLPQRAGFSGSLFGNSSYKVTPKFTISGSGGMMRSSYTILNSGTFQGFYQVNFGYKFLKDKLSATINFNNFLKKDMEFRTIADNENFRTKTVFSNPYRVVFFGVTWNFGKLTENVSKKKGVTNDDLVGGTGGQGNN